MVIREIYGSQIKLPVGLIVRIHGIKCRDTLLYELDEDEDMELSLQSVNVVCKS